MIRSGAVLASGCYGICSYSWIETNFSTTCWFQCAWHPVRGCLIHSCQGNKGKQITHPRR